MPIIRDIPEDGNDLTEFGVFAERHDIPVFDRGEAYSLWAAGHEHEASLLGSHERAAESGYIRRGKSRKNQF